MQERQGLYELSSLEHPKRAGASTLAVVDEFGEVEVADTVEAFLPTREGDCFSGGPKARETEGPIMARLRRLRATMQ